jgi:hypothetical protein
MLMRNYEHVMHNVGAMSARAPRSLQTHLAVWGMALALLLKAAVPMLASTAAQLQGKTVAEVCPLYGVATVIASAGEHAGHHHGGDDAPANHPQSAHGGDHCALAGLGVFAPSNSTAPVGTVDGDDQASPPPRTADNLPDACARWVARLKHGPPVLA